MPRIFEFLRDGVGHRKLTPMVKELGHDWHGQGNERARKFDAGQRVP